MNHPSPSSVLELLVATDTEPELDLDDSSVEPDPEPSTEPEPEPASQGEPESSTEPESFNLFPPLVGSVSAATIAAAGVFTAYGATGLIIGAVGAGAGLVALAPSRGRRSRGPVGRALSRMGVGSKASRGSGAGSGSLARRARGARAAGGAGSGSGRGGSGRGVRGSGLGSGRPGSGSSRLSRGVRGGGGRGSGRGSGSGFSSGGGVGSGRSAAARSGRGSGGGFGSGSSRGSAGRSGSSRVSRGSGFGSGGGFGSGRGSRGGGLGGSSRSGAARAGSGGRGSGRRSGVFGSSSGGLLGSGRRGRGVLSPSRPSGGLAGVGWAARRARKAERLTDKPEHARKKRLARVRSAIKRVRAPMSKWTVRAFRAVVPLRARQWMRLKWAVVKNPRAWWERIQDPIWRWRNGYAHPWELKVAGFFKGMWDATKEVFERGDPREEGYWKDKYEHLRGWEKSLVAVVLGSWLVLANPFRRAVSPRMPDTVTYPEPDAPGGGSGGSDSGEGSGMSASEQAMLEAAEIFAESIENFCKDSSMLAVGRGLESLAPAEERIAKAFATLASRMRDEMPLNEDFIEGVDIISEGHFDVASTCEELPSSWRASHDTEISRLENPRVREEDWDVSANRE